MRCRQGDLAMIIKSYFDFEGNIVEVVRPAGCVFSVQEGWLNDAWEVRFRGSMKHPVTGRSLIARDGDLKPLRDQEGEDEMLLLVGLITEKACT